MLADIGPFPDAVLGPYGVLILLLVLLTGAGRILWWFIMDVVKQRDFAFTGWREQAAATQAVAKAAEERNRIQAEEARLERARAEGAAEVTEVPVARKRKHKVVSR